MSDDLVKKALRAFEAGPQFVPMNDFQLMCEEVTRLREIATKLNEYRLDQSYRCPWCNTDDDIGEQHAADCSVFTTDGAVK